MGYEPIIAKLQTPQMCGIYVLGIFSRSRMNDTSTNEVLMTELIMKIYDFATLIKPKYEHSSY